jgi:retinol-binding protein 3
MRLLIFLLLISFSSTSQTSDTKLVLTPKFLKEFIDTLTFKINYKYVLPEKATKMNKQIRDNYKNGNYDKITDPVLLADILTKDILSVHNDEHFFIEYNPKLARQLSLPRDSVYWAEQLKIDRAKNHGFKKVEILNGNIGYLELSSFAFLNKESERIANSTFQLLSNCKAIIIDLQYGMGGQPEMVCCIAKHFLKDTTHILQSTFRNQEYIYNYYSFPDTNYEKLYNVPLYILTSYKTFSAGELFPYVMKNLNRAIIVGEQTRGGAHSGAKSNLFGDFIIALPHGKAYSEVTKSNWEGKGVIPDIKCKADLAIETAEKEIFKGFIKETQDSIELNTIKWQYDLLISKNHEPFIDSTLLKKRCGTFNYIDITFVEGQLYYEKVGKTKFPLIPMTQTKMRLRGNDSFIVEFIADINGEIKEIVTYYEDQRVERSTRKN